MLQKKVNLKESGKKDLTENGAVLFVYEINMEKEIDNLTLTIFS